MSFAFESTKGVSVIKDESGLSSFPFFLPAELLSVTFSLSYLYENYLIFSHFRD